MRKSVLLSLRIKLALSSCLHILADMQTTFFSGYLQRDYINRQYYYEKIVCRQRKRFFHKLQTLRRLVASDAFILTKIQRLFAIICALHQLRFRVKDPIVFEMCQQEMVGIEKSAVNLLRKLAPSIFHRRVLPDPELFQKKIDLLEQFYEGTLRLISSEPIVFLFFLQDLYALKAEIYHEDK